MFYRNCPICDNQINYSTKYSFLAAQKKNTKCKSCGIKSAITDEVKEEMKKRMIGAKNPMFGKTGELNPFFNKKHTQETKLKMIQNRSFESYKTDDFRIKISNLVSGNKNPMYGRTFYDVWVEKYGKEIANEKLILFRKKQSKNNIGEKNGMFGKPSPIGSGNGWSGWYNGWFFRSILELSYMIKIIERYKIDWVSGENDKYRIEYQYRNEKRNYYPDFILNEKYVVEIKPSSLWNSELVKLKKIQAENYCKNNNLIYKLTKIQKLTTNEIIVLYESKKIIFTERYEKKFIQLLQK
jgi:hypothetical protein